MTSHLVSQKLPRCKLYILLESVTVRLTIDEAPIGVQVSLDNAPAVNITSDNFPGKSSRVFRGPPPTAPVHLEGDSITVDSALTIYVTIKGKGSGPPRQLEGQTLPIWPPLSLTSLRSKSIVLGLGRSGDITVVFGIDESRIPEITRFVGDPYKTLSPSLPTLQRLLEIIANLKNLPLIETARGQYMLSWYVLVSLYGYLERYPADKEAWILQQNVHDIENERIDPYNLRYNAAEDLLCHLSDVVEFSVRFKNAYSEQSGIPVKVLNVLAETLPLVATCSSLLLGVAHRYFKVSYASLRISPHSWSEELEQRHYLLLRQRVRMTEILHDGEDAASQALAATSLDLIELVYERALFELRDTPDWPWNSFTASFCGVRGCIQDSIAERIEKDIKNAQKTDATHRDRLRRLLAYILQRTGTTPECLRLRDGQISVRTDVQHKMNSRINPVANDGSGSYANVYQGSTKRYDPVQKKNVTRLVALKCLRFPPQLSTVAERVAFKKETVLELITAWTLSHKHVLSVEGVSFDFGPLTLVSAWMSGGNTVQYLKLLRSDRTYQGKLHNMSHRWIGEIASGLDYVHEEGIVHGDLRGANILVDDDGSIKIADFGLSLFAEGHAGNYHSRRVSHPLWTAPEILDPENSMLRLRPTRASDMYSFAIVCVELYTIDAPIVPPGATRPSRPTSPEPTYSDLLMPRALWEIVEQCWHQDPKKRPRIHEARCMLKKIDI